MVFSLMAAIYHAGELTGNSGHRESNRRPLHQRQAHAMALRRQRMIGQTLSLTPIGIGD
jgi:hypothetical protein